MNRTLTRLSRLAADPVSVSDAGLLDAFVSGRDGTASEALVRRHGPMVLHVVLSVDPGEAVNNNETVTNYQLRPGDRVFVRVKLGK
jgi:hypothetical protein